LDDYHNIHDNKKIKAMMDFLLEHLPKWVHFVVISRKKINLNIFRLIANRNVYEINTENLAFTQSEIDTLYSSIFNKTLCKDELEKLRRKTMGWAVGLIVFHYSLKNKGLKQLKEQLKIFGGSSCTLENYFEENVFSLLSLEIKTFLIKTSILPYLDTRFCNQLLDTDQSQKILRYLERSNLFISTLNRDDRKIFFYHNMFKEFLQNRLALDKDAQSVSQLYCRAAQLLVECNEPYEAIKYYLKGEDYGKGANLIVKEGFDMIEKGLLDQVIFYCRSIPETIASDYPWLTYILGEAVYLNGNISKAIEIWKTTHQTFKHKKNEYGAALCLSRQVTGYFYLNDSIKAKKIFKQLLGQTTPDSILHLISLGKISITSEIKNINLYAQQYWDMTAMAKLFEVMKNSCFKKEPVSCFKTEQLKFCKSVFETNSTVEKNKRALYIHCFGTFSIFRQGVEMVSHKWGSLKAKQLLKYLAIHSAKGGIHKDRLLEILWPNQDPTLTSNRLNVALSTIRKHIEPGFQRKERPTYLVKQGETYRLNLGPDDFIDTAAFDLSLSTARKTEESNQKLQYYLKTESFYKGHLLEEEPYTQWCIELRERYKEKYVVVLKKIAALYQALDQPDRGIEYLRKALRVEEYAEDIYFELINLYYQTNNRFMAIKTYEQCKHKVGIELQCPLSTKIKQIYKQVLTV
jgi:DNA-binding SARP family transcriptional activator